MTPPEHAPRNAEGRYICCSGHGEHFEACYVGHLERRLRAVQDALSDLVFRVENFQLSGCHCPPGRHDSLCVLKPVDESAADTFLASTS